MGVVWEVCGVWYEPGSLGENLFGTETLRCIFRMRESNLRELEALEKKVYKREKKIKKSWGKLLFEENLETFVTFSVLTCTHYICDLNMPLLLTDKLEAVLRMSVSGWGKDSHHQLLGPQKRYLLGPSWNSPFS